MASSPKSLYILQLNVDVDHRYTRGVGWGELKPIGLSLPRSLGLGFSTVCIYL